VAQVAVLLSPCCCCRGSRIRPFPDIGPDPPAGGMVLGRFSWWDGRGMRVTGDDQKVMNDDEKSDS